MAVFLSKRGCAGGGITAYVQSCTTTDKSYVTGNYIDLPIVSYTDTGDVILAAAALQSYYSCISWVADSLPDGVTLTTHGIPESSSVFAAGTLQCCLISGITKPCNITVWVSSAMQGAHALGLRVSIKYI